MSDATDGTSKEGKRSEPLGGLLKNVNWPLMRKFETLVFACMLALLPFFAMRVVGVTETSLMVKNTTVDLVKDLRKAKQLARDHALPISVVSRAGTPLEPSAYLIEDQRHMIEEIVLPRGVAVEGQIVFDPAGVPVRPATFVIKKGPKNAQVTVDAKGIISAP
ncbi:MAG TPA: hypothetical protein V6C81_20145 [Planktothrix sp.]